MTFGQRAFLWMQYLLPHHAVSRVVRGATRIGWRPIKALTIKKLAGAYRINTDEALHGADVDAYRNFNDFFTRALKPGSRPIANSPWVSPADGILSQFGPVTKGDLVQAKGHTYSVEALLGHRDQFSQRLQNGSFFTVYLSPRDYHRVHMPASGTRIEQRDISGRLYSVAAITVDNIPGLFTRNARRISLFEDAEGHLFAVVLVGAINVSSMDTIWDDTPEVSAKVAKGDEMGRFNLGSTVVVVTEQSIDFADNTAPGQAISLGNAIGE